jgi:hypothetical protein
MTLRKPLRVLGVKSNSHGSEFGCVIMRTLPGRDISQSCRPCGGTVRWNLKAGEIARPRPGLAPSKATMAVHSPVGCYQFRSCFRLDSEHRCCTFGMCWVSKVSTEGAPRDSKNVDDRDALRGRDQMNAE